MPDLQSIFVLISRYQCSCLSLLPAMRNTWKIIRRDGIRRDFSRYGIEYVSCIKTLQLFYLLLVSSLERRCLLLDRICIIW